MVETQAFIMGVVYWIKAIYDLCEPLKEFYRCMTTPSDEYEQKMIQRQKDVEQEYAQQEEPTEEEFDE